MIRPYTPAILLAFCSLFTSSFACHCTGQGTVKSGVESSTVVFTGIVLKIEYFGLLETIDPDSLAVARSLPHEGVKNFLETPTVTKATILVTNSFKGVSKSDTIVVYTGIRGATCGFKFEPNKEYTVYATTENYMYTFFRLDRQRFRNLTKKGIYWTSICSRTTIAVGKEQGLLNEHFGKK